MNDRSWKKLQIKIWERDENKCQCCGTNKRLCVHHIDGSGDWHKHSFANNNEDNLKTLCVSCHAKTHWKNKQNLLNTKEAL